MLPDDLERAWAWLEDHGYAVDAPGGYYVTVSGEDDSSILFTADGTLEGWLEPDEPGYADVLPIGEADGSGSIIALGAEPEDPVETDQFREWVEGTFGVTVPSAWPALSDHPDDFGSWMAKQLGEEPDEAVPPPSDSPGARVDGELTRFMALLGEADDHSAVDAVASLLGVSLGETLRESTKALAKAGVEVRSTRDGVQTIWITMEDYPRSAELVSGLGEDPTRAQVLSFLGEPEKAGEKWLRYVIGGRYMHFAFDDRLTMITLMVDAP